MKEKTIEIRQEDEAGNMTIATRRIGLAVWQIVALFVVVGAGVALWWFDRHLTKEEAQIPNHEQDIRKLEAQIERCTLSIETANKGLELIPKFNIPEPKV